MYVPRVACTCNRYAVRFRTAPAANHHAPTGEAARSGVHMTCALLALAISLGLYTPPKNSACNGGLMDNAVCQCNGGWPEL